MAKNTFNDFSTTPASNADIAGIGVQGTNQVLNFDDAFRTLMAILRRDVDNGAVYASKSAGYTALETDNNAVHRFTATATIALTAAATLGANWHYTVLADGADITIDPDSAETINGVATLRVPNGSQAYVICTGTAFIAFVTPRGTFGECRLALSGGNLVLSGFNGRRITINGATEGIPSAGVSLAPTGLTPATLYYIYAYMNSGTMTLEASTTGHSTDATTGVEIKTGDATRTLVGMARVVTGPIWADTAKARFVRSWFNDPGVSLFNNFTANRATVNNSLVELSAEIRCEALLWAGEQFEASGVGACVNGAASGGNRTTLAFNGTTPEPNGSYLAATVAGDTGAFSCCALKAGLSEGYNYVTLLGCVQTGGTGTWYGDIDSRRAAIVAKARRT